MIRFCLVNLDDEVQRVGRKDRVYILAVIVNAHVTCDDRVGEE